MHNDIIFSVFIIFSGAAILATLALYSRQSLLIAYIVLGVLVGPSGAKLIHDPSTINDIGDIGIIFLLFLLGLNLQPQNLLKLLKETTLITVASSIIFALIGYLIGFLLKLTAVESLVLGACLMFSSTIIGLKLLPTTVMHHQKIGEIVISILLLQDVLAITALMLLNGFGADGKVNFSELSSMIVGLPILIASAFLIEKFVLMRILKRFNRIHEYLFLVAIGWCLGLGQLAEWLNLSFEVGAFIAGISIAQSPISRFIAENLKPLRDFFLILFFFSLGASINVVEMQDVLLVSIIMAGIMLWVKPLVFYKLLKSNTNVKNKAWEVGVRIGQLSEFSLLLGYTAHKAGLISNSVYYIIQASTIFSFVLSSYWIVNRYPTPIALTDKLRRD